MYLQDEKNKGRRKKALGGDFRICKFVLTYSVKRNTDFVNEISLPYYHNCSNINDQEVVL